MNTLSVQCKGILKTVVQSYFITIFNLLFFAMQYSISNNFFLLILVIINLIIMIKYLTNCNKNVYSIRLFCTMIFQFTNIVLFFRTNMFNILFEIINPNYGRPSAGTGFSMLILLPIYIVSFIISFIVSLLVQILKRNR